jgi:hypothetical protein
MNESNQDGEKNGERKNKKEKMSKDKTQQKPRTFTPASGVLTYDPLRSLTPRMEKLRTLFQEDPFSCLPEGCSIMNQLNAVITHEAFNRLTVMSRVVCPICKFSCCGKSGYMSHIKLHERWEQMQLERLAQELGLPFAYRCPVILPPTSTKKRSTSGAPAKPLLATPSLWHSCDDCKLTYNNRGHYNIHMRDVHDEANLINPIAEFVYNASKKIWGDDRHPLDLYFDRFVSELPPIPGLKLSKFPVIEEKQILF